MKNKEGVVSAIKVTLRNYKHSDPAVLVDIFSIGRNQCVIFLQRLRIQGSGVPLCVPCFVSRTYFTRHYRMHFVIATSMYQVMSPIVFALEQHRGQQPGGCWMHRLELPAG